MAEGSHQADELERDNEQLRSQLKKCQEQFDLRHEHLKSLVDSNKKLCQRQQEAVAMLRKAIAPRKEGGLFQSNSASPLKQAIEDALKLLE